MRLLRRELDRRAKTLVILVAVLLVSAGLCGFQWFTPGHGGLGELIYVRLPLGLLELLAMFVSACWIVILLIAWCAEALYERYRKRPEVEVQKLIEGEGTDKRDGEQR